MDVQVSLEAGAGCDHSKLLNCFSNAVYRQKSTHYKIRIRGRAKYILGLPFHLNNVASDTSTT